MGSSHSSASMSIVNSVLQETMSNSLSTIDNNTSNGDSITQNQTVNLSNISGCDIKIYQGATMKAKFITKISNQTATKIASAMQNAIKTNQDGIQKTIVGMLGGIGRNDSQDINEDVSNTVNQIISNTVTSENINSIINTVAINQDQVVTLSGITCRPGQKIDIEQNGVMDILATAIVNNVIDTALQSKTLSDLSASMKTQQTIVEKGIESLLDGLFKLLMAIAIAALVIGIIMIFYKKAKGGGMQGLDTGDNDTLIIQAGIKEAGGDEYKTRKFMEFDSHRKRQRDRYLQKANSWGLMQYIGLFIIICAIGIAIYLIIKAVRYYKKKQSVASLNVTTQADIDSINKSQCNADDLKTPKFFSCINENMGGTVPSSESNIAQGPYQCEAAANRAIRTNKCNLIPVNPYYCPKEWVANQSPGVPYKGEYWGFEKNSNYDWDAGKTQVPYYTGSCVKKPNAKEAPYMCKAACDAAVRNGAVGNHWGCEFDDKTGLFTNKCIQYPSYTVKRSIGGKDHVYFADFKSKADCEASGCKNLYSCKVDEFGNNVIDGKNKCEVYLPQQKIMLQSLGFKDSDFFGSLDECNKHALCAQTWGCGPTSMEKNKAIYSCMQYPNAAMGDLKVVWHSEKECNDKSGGCKPKGK